MLRVVFLALSEDKLNDETSTVEGTETAATADDALFDAGFAGDDSIPTDNSQPEEGSQEQEQTEQPTEAQPKYVQITEDQLNNLLNTATQIDQLKGSQEKGLSTAFGKIGGIERTLNQLKDARTATGEISLTEEDINKLEFPEVARELIPFIQSKIRVAPSEQTAFDPQHIETLAEQIADKKLTMMSMENLDDEIAGWREIVGLPGTDGKIPDTAYRKWLAVQPEPYRERLNTTSNGAVISRSIQLFKKAQEEAEAKTKRQDRFNDAVQPRGTGEHQPGSKADDDFESGFATG